MRQCLALQKRISFHKVEISLEINKQKLKQDQTLEFKSDQQIQQVFSYLSLNFEENRKKKSTIKIFLESLEEVKLFQNAETSSTNS